LLNECPLTLCVSATWQVYFHDADSFGSVTCCTRWISIQSVQRTFKISISRKSRALILTALTYGFLISNQPLIGMLITFAVFFGDSVLEAAFMWVIEAAAVICEVYVFRLRSIAYEERMKRLEKTDEEIKTLRETKKKVKQLYESGHILSTSHHSVGSVSEDDDSFHDETGSNDNMTTGGKSTGTDISKVRENKLYRERRVLRESNANDRRHLRYHLIGVCLNCFLLGLSLLLICVISKNKGLCIVDMEPPNVFLNNQLERCFSCKGVEGTCEICHTDGTSQCYYPYGKS
jgi:hypothetical protein